VSGPLIATGELAGRLAGRGGGPTLLDVRWSLAAGAEHEQYLSAHIPGAAFIDLDHDLAAAPGPGGRHPMPDRDEFAAAMRRAGVSTARPVVVYDAATSMSAARAWWLLRYFGHEDVSVLDGGLGAWIAAGYPTETGERPVQAGDFEARPGGMQLLDAAGALELAGAGVLLDARAPERFHGRYEPLDPVAGHIPGARNRPTTENVGESGAFLDGDLLRAGFERAGVRSGMAVGAYCGSGVTAAHEILALEVAGIPAALYLGSWSDWISDPSRPVATATQT
jgi:thiosulfate/3-mercaptopyruvate sulfurtransferase